MSFNNKINVISYLIIRLIILTIIMKSFLLKLIPKSIFPHFVELYQIMKNPYNENKFLNVFKYFHYIILEKKGDKILKAKLINGNITLVYPDSNPGVSDLYDANDYLYLDFIRNNIKKNTNIVDAGCNVGNRTLSLDDIILGGLLIDGNKTCLDRVKENFELNNVQLKKYKLLNNLVGFDVGYYHFDDNGGADTINKINKNAQGNKVYLDRIDNLVAKYKINNLGLIKTDVEGFDFDALRGAQETINKNRDCIIFFERWDGVDINSFYELFNNLSFKIFALNSNKKIDCNKSIIAKSQNLFAISEKKFDLINN